ncbi:predicted protein [Escherichia albertii]|nr:predicted protein [Escherichia albertii]
MKNKIRHIAHDILSNYKNILHINKEEYNLQKSLNYIKCDRKIRAARDLNVDVVFGTSFDLCSVFVFSSYEFVHESVNIKITPVTSDNIKIRVNGYKHHTFYISPFSYNILGVCHSIKNDILTRAFESRMKLK